MSRNIANYAFRTVAGVLFPATCACCGDILMAGERQICINCLADLARTGYSPYANNPVERTLMGRVPFECATALYHYRKGNTVQHLIHAMKFHGRSSLCTIMGRQLGLDLMGSGRFDDVDLLLPVPLHWTRKLQRGYNQSELICQGIAEVMHRPISRGDLIRPRRTHKQSQQKEELRIANVENAFRVRHSDKLQGRHILLVDDVLTTGATLMACTDALAVVSGIRISVATLSTVAS